MTKQPDTSTEKLTEKLDEIVVDLRKNLPADVHVSTDIFRQSHFIDNSINNVKKSLFEGSFFVVIVLFLFLMNIRTTVISLVALPLSLLVSIIVLHYMGLTINTMSLGGMAIAIGSLVDDAIVDVENVYKRIRENRLLPPDQQRSILEVVYDASREVRMPILELYLDYRGELRTLVLLEWYGRPYVGSAGYRFYRGVVCFYGSGAYLEPRCFVAIC